MTRVSVTAPENAGAIIVALRELVEALDRRIPDMERVGEAHTLEQAADLRAQALMRIRALSDARE